MNPMNDREWFDTRFEELWPITRSITGPGLRESLHVLQQDIPITIEAVPSGTEVYDWEIPPEWHISSAQLKGPNGETYADFDETNLAVMNYSEPVDTTISFSELDPHLYTDPEVPDATPYVTSYYERNWGFCLPHDRYETMPNGEYHAYIDSEFVDGELNYGHTILSGSSDDEVLLSSYLCHPSLANNELSGPLILTKLYQRLSEWDDRHYTYRFVLCPETIGSIAYLSEYGTHLQENLVAGFVLTCLGGPNESLSYKTTRQSDTLVDRTIENLKEYGNMEIDVRPFTPTSGSDERQYCSPGFDLPVGQLARTIYGEYEEYHNSKDDKNFLQIASLMDSTDVIETILWALDHAGYYENQNPYGEPMLSKRDLYPDVNAPKRGDQASGQIGEKEFLDMILEVLNYSDGDHALVDIATTNEHAVGELIPVVETLKENGLLQRSID